MTSKYFFEKSFKPRLSLLAKKKNKKITNELQTPKIFPLRRGSNIWIPVRVQTSWNLHFGNENFDSKFNMFTPSHNPNHKRIHSSLEVSRYTSDNKKEPKIKINGKITNDNLSWIQSECK